jgi:UDP-N-acetylmuramoyl-tripeptide--D-alanyl-D-alanine ligase
MNLTLETCAQWMNGQLVAASDLEQTEVTGYSIDSRTLHAGELFFAVSGERFDGHAFVGSAFQQGAAAAVIARDKAAPPEIKGIFRFPHILVDDPLLALQRLGAAVRQHWHGTLIGLTGSAGKTTTKEMVASVLSVRHTVLKSAGNLNNHFGVPLQLLRLEPEHTYAVIEMGMSAAGEIALLASLAQPDWAVVTNVGVAHAQNFTDGIEGIARAKQELVDALDPATGIAFLNADDPRVAGFAAAFPGRSILAGCSDRAAVRAVSVEERGIDGIRMDVVSEQSRANPAPENQARVELHFLGAHNANNALLALAVGLEAGVSLAQGAAALAALSPGDKRGELLAVRGAQLINDSYNSNPAALSAMIRALAQMPAQRRILVAGEMLAEAAAKAGTPSLFLENAEEAGAWLQRELRSGDAVLLKGSRGVHLERALIGL